MSKLNALLILTAFSLVCTPLYADMMGTEMAPMAPDANMNKPSVNMQTNDQQSTEMHEEMKKMQDMHNEMMSAKTPEEKKKLMEAQVPMMQNGMNMMKMMGDDNMGGDITKRQETMEKRMMMMQMMMQMMMDRQMMDMPKTKTK